jgi:hypothetical protein
MTSAFLHFLIFIWYLLSIDWKAFENTYSQK